MKNIGYKIATISLVICLVMIIIAYSPRSYTPSLVATATLDFANTTAGNSTDLTIIVTGAEDGDPVIIGIPNGSTSANGHFVGWVSSSNTVTVRFLNNSLVGGLNPASGLFKVIVHKK